MKLSRHISFVVSGSLTLLAGSLFAQGGVSALSSPGSASSTPSTHSSSGTAPGGKIDPTPPYNPTRSETTSSGINAPEATSPTSVPGVDPVTMPSTAPSPGNPYDPTASSSTPSPATSPTNSRANSSGAADRPASRSPGAVPLILPVGRFGAYDTDRDGRLSLREFQAAPASLGNGASSTNASPSSGNSSAVASASPKTNRATGAPGSRTDPNPATSTAPGMSSSSAASIGRVDSAQTFHQLDANHDGYLTQAEIAAYRNSIPAR